MTGCICSYSPGLCTAHGPPPERKPAPTARLSSWTCSVCRAYVPGGVQHPDCPGARKDASDRG